MAVPDPLHRFVATPHREFAGRTLIESNDLIFLRKVSFHFWNAFTSLPLATILHLKIVIDYSLAADGAELTSLDCGLARLILRGTNTVVFYDAGTGEVLCFIAPEISADEFIERLLPAALAPSAELQTSDMDSIAR